MSLVKTFDKRMVCVLEIKSRQISGKSREFHGGILKLHNECTLIQTYHNVLKQETCGRAADTLLCCPV